ncbi:hypothetical protein [Tianweitania sediminis]|uniref:Uncharacterized protein n=1 Tax=Tianweitania sediminis TaxID=1502156 RepID=A0A8J7QWR8_9HYPH|nr:hypothetical protein [Tianweitania sediminis]MBP0438068.1 hypothetical protein [Tianweitania sediminis]
MRGVARTTAFLVAAAFIPIIALAQTPAGFEFQITLSKQAAQRLASSGEGITVQASYYGEPKKGAEKHVDEMGQIYLGDERIDLPGKAATARINGSGFEQAAVKWLDGPAMVNVNIFSSRKAGPDNILSCDLIDGELQVVRKSRFAVHCALIEEGMQTELKP